jgi:hypothetical protein
MVGSRKIGWIYIKAPHFGKPSVCFRAGEEGIEEDTVRPIYLATFRPRNCFTL